MNVTLAAWKASKAVSKHRAVKVFPHYITATEAQMLGLETSLRS